MLKPIPELLKEAAKNVRRISAEVASSEISENQGLLIDVREPAEHQTKGAEKAINIPRGLIEMQLTELEKDPNRPIYLHCASSARATLAAEQLARIGYQNVSVITCNVETIIKTIN